MNKNVRTFDFIAGAYAMGAALSHDWTNAALMLGGLAIATLAAEVVYERE